MANPFRLPMAGRSLRNLVSRPATRRYPVEVREPFAGARGTIELDLDTCVFCSLCVRRCPAVALSCSREEQWFAIEQLNCISCGVCVDVCNKNSLRLSEEPPGVLAGVSGGRPGRREWRKATTAAGQGAAEAAGIERQPPDRRTAAAGVEAA